MSTAELIRRLLNRRARLENRSAAELLRLLQESRRDILAELLSPHGRFDDFRFRVMISVIDRKIAEASALSGRVVDTAVRGSWEAGLEFGAIGEALAYKKQYQKADYYFQRKEAEVNKRIAQEKAKLNSMLQRVSSGYRVSNVGRLTGDVPYAA